MHAMIIHRDIKRYLIVDVAWLFVCFILTWSVWVVTHNTLAHNGQWISTKASMGMYVTGSESFVSRTQALAGNALHLDTWNGFQEIITKNHVKNPARIEFDVSLSPDSYIYAEFNRTTTAFSAFRLSRNSKFPSAFIVAKTSGEFIGQYPIDIKMTGNSSMHVEIFIMKSPTRARLVLNHTIIAEFPIRVEQNIHIGFRGGLHSSKVSNIRVIEEDGNEAFFETFQYHDQSILILLFIFFIILFYTWEVVLLKTWVYQFVLPIQGGICICLIFLYGVTLYSQDKYPRLNGLYGYFLRNKATRSQTDFVEEKTVNYKIFPPKKAYRIVFVGSSQTWGSGAPTLQTTFVSIAAAKLQKKIPVEIINSGLEGVSSAELLPAYSKWIVYLKPDMVVINLSNNDRGDVEAFAANLQRFVNMNANAHIATVFILEANSQEMGRNIDKAHVTMHNIGRSYAIPIIDLHSYLLSQNSNGIIWWDYVHPTEFGHRLAGQYIADRLYGLVDLKTEQAHF